jgi:anti-anti-sigma factor
MGEDADGFRIELAHLDGYERIRFRGELDYAAASTKADAIEELAGLRHNVVIDLTEVPFMDSGGLAALVQIGRDHEGPVQLVGVQPAVRRLLVLTGLDRSFQID